jgi:hypothetical protein
MSVAPTANGDVNARQIRPRIRQGETKAQIFDKGFELLALFDFRSFFAPPFTVAEIFDFFGQNHR